MNRRVSDIFVVLVALALFLDAVNVDTFFASPLMVHEEYAGQYIETYMSGLQNDSGMQISGSINLVWSQRENIQDHPSFLTDEDSVSFAAHPMISEEIAQLFCRDSIVKRIEYSNPYSDFHSLCKLQI